MTNALGNLGNESIQELPPGPSQKGLKELPGSMFFLFKTSEGVWSSRSNSTCWKLFPGVTRFCSAIFAMVSRWWFQSLWVFFYRKQLEKQIERFELCIIFLFTSSAERNHQTSLFRSYFARIGCSMCFFSPVSEAMFWYCFDRSQDQWPSSTERNQGL